MADPLDLVTLEEAQEALKTTEDLSAAITRVSRIIREWIGPIIHESIQEHLDGGASHLFLTYYPVVPGTVTVTDRYTGAQETAIFVFEDGGMVEHERYDRWPSGARRFRVEYMAGYAADVASVPAGIKKAVFIMLRQEMTGGEEGKEIVRESIGDWSVEYSTPGEGPAVDPVEKYLEPFRRVRV